MVSERSELFSVEKIIGCNKHTVSDTKDERGILMVKKKTKKKKTTAKAASIAQVCSTETHPMPGMLNTSCNITIATVIASLIPTTRHAQQAIQ